MPHVAIPLTAICSGVPLYQQGYTYMCVWRQKRLHSLLTVKIRNKPSSTIFYNIILLFIAIVRAITCNRLNLLKTKTQTL